MKQRNVQPKIGLALGGGGAKGWSHIGVINALEHLGIRPTIIAGTSMGALVGAAYASDRLNKLEKWAKPMTWKDVIGYLDITISGGGFIQGEKLLDAMQKQAFDDVPIEALPKTFGAVATQLRTGQEVWLREGALMKSVRASIALPGLFTPVMHEGNWLIDGGLVNPVPVSLCRALGADIVIAVNLYAEIASKPAATNEIDKQPNKELSEAALSDEENNLWAKLSKQLSNQLANGIQEGKEALLSKILQRDNDMPGIFEVFSNTISIMQNRITRSRMAGDPPDVILSPKIADIGTIDFHKAEPAIAEGEECVYRMRPILEDVLKETLKH
ncbi:MAG: patatin-like phospholipase RssA [Thiotrichaceae bacterium]